ncbi:MAG: hypothetical protein WC302_00715 [Candidatus Paceibacterota bacterium]|jgi:hypothetical protein
MIINVPIESLEERYSKQWNEWFPRVFEELDELYFCVYPKPLSDKIRDGSFLDVCATNYFKANQLAGLCQALYNGRIHSGDVIFFHDLWFPGLEMLAYIRDGLGIDFKICGILHAGTYDPFDFVSKKGMGRWGKNLEESWFSFVDEIFVATRYHRDLIYQSRRCRALITVTGLPIYYQDIRGNKYYEKENIVVFPHRLDSEKQPALFDQLANILQKKYHDWQFIKTKEVCETKQQYYDLLGRSKVAVSFAFQETWGIAQQEALIFGCIPIVPNRLSYREMYPESLKYEDMDQCIELVERAMKGDELLQLDSDILFCNLKAAGEEAIPNMVERMRRWQKA